MLHESFRMKGFYCLTGCLQNCKMSYIKLTSNLISRWLGYDLHVVVDVIGHLAILATFSLRLRGVILRGFVTKDHSFCLLSA